MGERPELKIGLKGDTLSENNERGFNKRYKKSY